MVWDMCNSGWLGFSGVGGVCATGGWMGEEYLSCGEGNEGVVSSEGNVLPPHENVGQLQQWHLSNNNNNNNDNRC